MNTQNQAKAIYAFKNNGVKAPISVMFAMETSQNGGSAHNRMVSRALGNPNTTKMTVLLSYTEEQFDIDFADKGVKASDITTGYRDAAGEVVAKPLDFTTEELFGEALGLRRIDTTDFAAISNEDGTLKPQWSVKRVKGQELTHEGALIYSTVEFCELGEESIRLKQDQDLSRNRIEENIPSKNVLEGAF